MKQIAIAIVLLLFLASTAFAQTADEVLKIVDDTLHKAKNCAFTMKMTVIDADGTEKVRVSKVWNQGNKRLLKFIKPASEKGIALLTDKDSNTNYIYMPNYKRIRRVAAHARNQTFMGSDFTQEDIGSSSYANDYTPKLTGQDDTYWELELTKKPSAPIGYSKLQFKVHKKRKTLDHIVYFDKNGEKLKTEVRSNYKFFQDKYWEMTTIVMTSAKDNHKTRLEMNDMVYDQDLPDDFFTQRNLKRPVR